MPWRASDTPLLRTPGIKMTQPIESWRQTMTDSSSSDELLVEQRGPALWLTINREERRNAMSHGVLAGMARAITAAQTDRGVRAIVITGVGSKAFCAGADLQASNTFVTD